jgi:hypothetical protein
MDSSQIYKQLHFANWTLVFGLWPLEKKIDKLDASESALKSKSKDLRPKTKDLKPKTYYPAPSVITTLQPGVVQGKHKGTLLRQLHT